MKVKNRDMLIFVNNAQKILQKRIPRKMYSAISQNMAAFGPMAETYNKQLEEVDKTNQEEIEELLDLESEVVLQTIPESVMDMMDQDKYDALTGIEYHSLEIFIEK